MIWEIIVAIYVLGVIWLVWEAMNAPVMPDDYDLSIEEEDILKDIQSRNDNERDNRNNRSDRRQCLDLLCHNNGTRCSCRPIR